MANDIITKLRNEVETQYAEALHAIDVLAKYLEGSAISVRVDERQNVAPRRGNGKKKSNRQLVLDALREHPGADIDELVGFTGLDKGRVRGVLYAPKLTAQIEKEIDENGYAKYTLKE